MKKQKLKASWYLRGKAGDKKAALAQRHVVTLKVKQILMSTPRQEENKLTVHHLQVLRDPTAWTPSSSWKAWL